VLHLQSGFFLGGWVSLKSGSWQLAASCLKYKAFMAKEKPGLLSKPGVDYIN
jgi:hypothetical protein